jgi:hypothetical protein
MALLGYNRKLLWVVLPAILWAWLGVAAALGPPPGQPPPGGEPPVRFGIGPAANGVYLSGVVKRVVEEPGQLTITIESASNTLMAPGTGAQPTPGADAQPAPGIPPGLKVEYVKPGELPPGPPELRLMGKMREGRRLPSGASGILTERFMLKIDERGVRIMPRPFELAFPPRGGPGGPEMERGRPRDRIRERAREWFGKRQRHEQPLDKDRKQPKKDRKKEDGRGKKPGQPGSPAPAPGAGSAGAGQDPGGASSGGAGRSGG